MSVACVFNFGPFLPVGLMMMLRVRLRGVKPSEPPGGEGPKFRTGRTAAAFLPVGGLLISE